MQRLGLSKAELDAYHRTLRTSHTREVEVAVLNLDGSIAGRVTPVVLDGQVVVDLDAEVTRTLTMSFLDPSHTLNFDTDSPDDGALYADRMLRVTYRVLVPELGRRVGCRVFEGPLVKLDRNGDVVSVEAHGKERLALGELWKPLTLKKGTAKVAAIRTILGRTGERRFAFPSLNSKLPASRSLDRFVAPWIHARKIAASMNRQLYYPGNGICTLRAWPDRPVYTFNTGRGGEVLTDVAISNNMDDLRNVVLVTGGKPKGAKKRVRHVATATGSLSPNRLGRNGEPRYLVERIEDDNLTSTADCRRRANSILNDRLRSVVEVTFDSLPVPHLDPGDVVRVQTDNDAVTFRLRRFSLPLGTDGAPVMPVGYFKKTYANRRRIRR